MERENKKSIGKYIQEIYEKVDNLKERLENRIRRITSIFLLLEESQ